MSDFCTTGELLKLPNPTWLIRSLLPDTGLSLLFGPSGEGKSFVAIDWALSVSTGRPWLGEFPAKQGHVLYIAAEGGQGIKKRVAAWMQHHGVARLPNITWFLNSLDFSEEGSVDRFMDRLRSRFSTEQVQVDEHTSLTMPFVDIRLVVIDTLSRCFGGEDENASTAMPAFIEKVEQFCREHGAAGLIIHHTNATGARERGHSSLKAAMESSFHCTASKDGARLNTITLVNNKQKDDIDGAQILLNPLRLELPGLPPDEEGQLLTSLVLEKTDHDASTDTATACLLEVLADYPEGLGKDRLVDRARANHEPPVGRGAVRRAVERAIAANVLRAVPGPHNTWNIAIVGAKKRSVTSRWGGTDVE